MNSALFVRVFLVLLEVTATSASLNFGAIAQDIQIPLVMYGLKPMLRSPFSNSYKKNIQLLLEATI